MNISEAKKYTKLLTCNAYINIIRDLTKTSYIWVRIIRLSSRKNAKVRILYQEVFLIKDYKNQEIALIEARKWRDKKYIEALVNGELTLPNCIVPIAYKKRFANNQSGECGVQLIDYMSTKRRANGEAVKYRNYAWAATFVQYIKRGTKIQRCPKIRQFSITKFGYDEAFNLANETRKEKEIELNSLEHLELRNRWRAYYNLRVKMGRY